MAFVPGAKNDVFISYAHFDNEGGVTGERWVSDFVQRLEGALKQRLGCPVSMYFDTRSLEGHQNLSEILENVRQSAIFVPILSPSYINRKWTRDELEAFTSLGPTESRVIFTIERLPLETEEEYPQALRERKRTNLWYRTEESDVVDIMTPTVKSDRYIGAITDVVDHMARQLRALKAQAEAGAAAGASAPGGVDVKVVDAGLPPVLLAQVTEDLDEQRDQVRRHLEQFGLQVLPAGLYPQGGAEFTKAFEADLARAGMFAQLLGPIAGRKPPDLQQGYAQYQFDAASAKGMPVMLWRRPDLDLSSVSGAHAALLGSPAVQAMSLQSFKAEIVRRMQKPPPPPPKPAKLAGGMVFINAVPDDAELASKLENDFVNEGCTVVLPAPGGAAEEILADLSENIIDCDALVLVYGSAENMWVRSQLKLYNKLKPKREEGDCVVLICNAPPGPKAPIGMRLPEAHEIDYASALSSEPVVQMLTKWRH